MNWIQFGRLFHSMYSRDGKLPDLEWIQGLGLLAVKLGQIHAVRIDFLEREKCEHLARLYRRNAALPSEDFLQLIREGAVPGFHDQFEQVEPQALASASVAQVHRARLKGGEEVVIKAIKRNLRAQFGADISSLTRLFRLATFIYPALRQAGDPIGILNEIEEYTLSELDLRNEVAGQRTLRRLHEQNHDSFDLSRLKFAQVHEPLCNENVMVSEFVDGRSFDELLEADQLPYDTLLELFRIHGFQMFCLGTFHGDMHPGNVLLADGKLCFIDTGCIGQVSQKIRRGLFAFFSALSAHDYPLCATALNQMSKRELTGDAFDRFQQELIELYADFKDRNVTECSLTRKMMETIKLGVRSGMGFEKGIFAIIRSLMYLDGMVLRCNPNAVLIRDMRPFINEFERKM